MAKYDIEAIHEYIAVILEDEELTDKKKVEMLKKVVQNLKLLKTVK